MKGKFLMSKKSKTVVQPVYNPSAALSVNGKVKSSAKSTKNGANANYNMSEFEEAGYNYANEALYNNLDNINVFSDETVKNLNKQLQAYMNQGAKDINETYTPMIRDMQNDVARRFGNTDNSVFMDNLKDIESKRADAISDLAQSTEAKRSEITDDELSRRYNYLNFLNNYQNQIYANMLSMLKLNNDFLNTNNSHLNGRQTSSSGSSSSGVNYVADAAKLAAQIVPLFL